MPVPRGVTGEPHGLVRSSRMTLAGPRVPVLKDRGHTETREILPILITS